MNTKFFDLKKSKQDAILNGILKVFSKNAYQYSGTDEIVREAKISKGLLFHYFINKIGAYEFAYDYSLKLIMFELNVLNKKKEEDYFQLWKQIEDVHLIVMRQYPYMLAFIAQVYVEKDCAIKAEIMEKESSLIAAYEQIFSGVNMEQYPKDSIIRSSTSYILNGINQDYYKGKELDIEKLYETKIEYLTFLQRLYRSI